MFAKDVDPAKLIRPTAIAAARSASRRRLAARARPLPVRARQEKRLLKLIDEVGRDYDRILLDAPPGLTETSEQVLRAADLIIVPVIPSPLSQRALDEVVAFLDRQSIRRGPILPVYNDGRPAPLAAPCRARGHPDWPVIPMASAFEAMSAAGGGVGRLARRLAGRASAVRACGPAIEKRLAQLPQTRLTLRPPQRRFRADEDARSRPAAAGLFDRRVPDVRRPRGQRPLLGRAAQARRSSRSMDSIFQGRSARR